MADKFQRSMKWPGLDDTYYFLPLVSEADNGKVMTVEDGEWAAGDEQASFDTEASGETIILDDAADRPLRGLRVLGKTTQNGTPTPDAPVPLVSVGDDGAIDVTVAGKNLVDMAMFDTMNSSGGHDTYDVTTHTITFDNDFTSGTAGRYKRLRNLLVGVTYTVSFDIRGTAGKIVACGWNGARTDITLTSDFVRYSSTEVVPRSDEAITFYSRLTNKGGLAAGEFMQFANVQVEIGSTATAYEPCETPQALTLATPNGLPGIPVPSGGNYTDADGQQWVCDEIDMERGVYVQRVQKMQLTSTMGTGWYAAMNGKRIYTEIKTLRKEIGSPIFCTHAVKGEWASDARGTICLGNKNVGAVGFSTADFATVDAVKAFLDANDVFIVAPLITPIETPLTDAEIAAYKALTTHYPTTTIYNDESAEMEVEYVNKNNFDADAVLFRKQTLTDAQKAQILDNIGASSRLQVHAVSVTTSLWVDSALHADYPYQALIPVNGATSEMYPDVVFDVTEALSGNYAPVADAANGGVLIYAKVVPEADIVVPTVTLWK